MKQWSDRCLTVGTVLLVLLGGCRWEEQEGSLSGKAPGESPGRPAPPAGETHAPPADDQARTGPYPDRAVAGARPTLFAPGFLSTGGNERDAAVSPDGRLFLFSLGSPTGDAFDIVEVRRLGGRWQPPRLAPFSDPGAADIEPSFGPDGETVYFASDRPTESGGEPDDWNIWMVRRRGGDWGEPSPVPGFARSDGDEFYPSLARDGSLYFTAERDGGFGGEDIYRAPFADGVFGEPENLGEAINGETDEFNAFVDPDDRFLIFSSYGREDGLGCGDLYISYRGADGEWSVAENLGDGINSEWLDYCPSFSPDGAVFFFSSRRPVARGGARADYPELAARYGAAGNGLGDLYWMDAGFLREEAR